MGPCPIVIFSLDRSCTVWGRLDPARSYGHFLEIAAGISGVSVVPAGKARNPLAVLSLCLSPPSLVTWASRVRQVPQADREADAWHRT